MKEKARMADSCGSAAMGLVALQLGAVAVLAECARRRPQLALHAGRWQGALVSFVLMTAGVFGLTQPGCQPAAWAAFTAGALVASLQFARMDAAALRRGALQAGAVLIAAAVAAPLFGYYANFGGALFFMTLLLLGALLLSLVRPDAGRERWLSAAGSALFAVWTVYDVAAKPCTCPWTKSVEVFLDVLNLFAFSAR